MMHYFENVTIGKKNFLSLRKASFLTMIFLLAALISFGQQTIPSVKGTVKSEDGELLTGASVMVPGTKLITSTKKDGTFELKDVPEKSRIRVSHVGHILVEMQLKPGQTEISVTMKTSAATMNEVVVNVGLYKRSAGNFTGASKTYSGEDLKMVNPTNVLKALAAVEPAIRIAEDNALGSDPNALPKIQLRGENNLPINTQGSANATASPVSNGDIMSGYLLNPNQPLIILDGFQTTLQTIYDLDINRIASITVLKDAAATTAYGSKAANGVIVVETKQPVAGRPQVTYSINTNIQLPDLSSYNLLDAEGLLEAQRLAGVYTDVNNHFNDVALKRWYDYRLQAVKSGVNTYWLSQPLQTAIGLNHSLNVSGGSRAIRYSLGVNYSKSEGVMKGSGRNSFGLNYNLTYTKGKIRFSNSTTVMHGKGNNSPWGNYGEYSKQFPFFQLRDEEGNFLKVFEAGSVNYGFGISSPGGDSRANAAYNSQLNIKDYSYYWGFTNNTNIEWTITNALRMRAAVSFANNAPGSEKYLPADHTSFLSEILAGMATMGSYHQMKGNNSVIDGRISMDYNKRIGKHGTLATATGFTVQETKSSSTSIAVMGIPNDFLNQLGMANGYGTNIKPASMENATRMVSTYASASYNYRERYTAEITVNASGSSQFGANNRLAPFWAGGASWNVDKEKFFKKNSVIQQLRMRLTSGIVGNQNFPAYLSQPIYNYNTLNNYRLQLGATVQGYANPDLKWQQTLKNNFGLTAVLFNSRLNFGFDYFDERTDNLILPLEVAPSTGFISYQDNLGSTKNTGYEFSISSPIIRNRKKEIYWTLMVNGGHYRNVITKLSPAIDALNKANNDDFNPETQMAPLPRFEVGQSVSRIWAVQSLGIDPATGKEVFLKRDGTKTFVWDAVDKMPVGDNTPVIKGAITSNFMFKGFTFNINLSYQYGGQKYNQTLVDKIENIDLRRENADERVLTERWKKPGDHTFFKSLVAEGSSNVNQITKVTSRFVQDDDFLEAASITVGYTLPKNLSWVRKLKLSTPRLFITQNNVFRFATIQLERGTSYPFSRSFNFGLSTTF